MTEHTAALNFAKEQIRTLFATSLIGAVFVTAEGKVLAANEALLQMMGNSEEEFLQQNVAQFFGDRGNQNELLEQLSESGTVSDFGVELKGKDDRCFFANINVSQVNRGGERILLALIEDVSDQIEIKNQLQQEIAERKMAEMELQSQITLVDNLLNVALDTIEIFDANDMGYIKWNRTFSEITGYSDEEIAKLDPAADFFDEVDLPIINAAVEKALEEGVVTARATLISKDGSRTPMEYTASITRDPEGKPTHFIGIGREITEQLRSEAALKESEQRFKTLFDSMPVPVYAWRRSGDDFVLVDHNEAADAITGGAMSNFLGITATTMYRDRPDIVADITRCFVENTSIQREMIYQFKSMESTKTLAVKYAFVPPDLVLVHTEDITRRKKAEEALLSSQILLKSSLDALSASIAILDEEGIIIALNESWRAFADKNSLAWEDYGLGRSYLGSIDSTESLDEGAVEANAGIRELYAGQRDSFIMEYPCHSPDEQRWFVIRASSFDSGDGLRVVVSHENVTEQVLARERILQEIVERTQAEEQLRFQANLLDAVEQAIIVTDFEGEVIYWNPYAEKMYGWSAAEVIGKKTNEFFISSYTQPPFPEINAAIFSGNSWTGEFQVSRRDGSLLPIQSTITAIYDESGEPVYSIGIAFDITERIRMEEIQQQLAVSEERDRLALDLHDTVTQSLYSITLQSDSTMMALSTGKSKAAEKRLETLKEIAHDAMAEMRLLIYQLQPSIIEEEGLVNALQQRLQLVEARAGIDVDFQVDGERQLSLNRQIGLFQAAQEGLNNVTKHARAKHLLIRLSYKPALCRLSIQDDGEGFSLEEIGPYGGFGLDSMRKRLAEFNGTLEIVTKPGSGTILNIEVPYE